MKTFLTSMLLLLSVLVSGQDAAALIRAVSSKLQKAKDYSVSAHIKVDMPFIRMMPIDATIYFKQKDKFKVDSKSIAIVPRQGFDAASKMLADTNGYTAVVQGSELIAGTSTTIVNVIPLSDTSDLILGRLWIDPKNAVILKSQLTTRSNGTILTEYTYGKQGMPYGLPDLMVFTVDVKKFRIPKGVATDINKSSTPDKGKKDEKKGKIFIALSNYSINKGIPDSIFRK